MPRHEYKKAHILHHLHDALTAAGVKGAGVAVEGDAAGQTVYITVPESISKATVDAVLAAHDAAAIVAAEAAQRQTDEDIRRQVFTAAAGAVGKSISTLTTTERNALIAVLLWRWGALSPTLTIRPLADWAYGVTVDRAVPGPPARKV